MYILTKNMIVNSEYVERFCVSEKSDAALVIASYSSERPPVTLERYSDFKEAYGALVELLGALAGGQACFTMPESRMYAGEKEIKDARVKRKGSS